MTNLTRKLVVAGLLLMTVSDAALAQRRGGGGRGGGRGGGMRGGGGGFRGGGGRPSVSRPNISRGSVARPNVGNLARPSNPIAGGINRGNINRGNINTGNINRGNINTGNLNRPVNVGDVDINSGWGYGDGYHGCCYHPVAAGAAVVAGAAITAAAIGSTSYALPSGCVTTVVNGITYSDCSGTWYMPQFNGTSTSYVVVGSPQ